ncbi:hypothetical protein C2G38_552886 [Gigaspora rosea]|uniref:Uncharacterized protein n=1 Tax=Gigaspora rosea TaxID=44941 RepID=A0A397UB21_9GLOM|nr:hypothetical protein C2G38_552886 [Gigaspora rosea]
MLIIGILLSYLLNTNHLILLSYLLNTNHCKCNLILFLIVYDRFKIHPKFHVIYYNESNLDLF